MQLIQRKSTFISTDDVYQGQIRMDQLISSSPAAVNTRVPSTSGAVLVAVSRSSHVVVGSWARFPDASTSGDVHARSKSNAAFSKERRAVWCPYINSFVTLRKVSKMRIIFVKFREISQKYPIIRGMASYSIIWPTANLLQQKIMGKEKFDYAETMRFSLYGSLYVAPTLYCWLRCASYFWPKMNLKSAITKALIEQVTYTPAAMCSFFFGMSLLELKPVSECIDEIKIKFWPTYKIAICIWPILQTVNFILIPERNRVVYVSVCSLVWTCFLAYMKSLETKEQKQKELRDFTNVNPKIISESKVQSSERTGHMQISLLR